MHRQMENWRDSSSALLDKAVEKCALPLGLTIATGYLAAMGLVEIDKKPVRLPADAHVTKYPDNRTQEMVINISGDPKALSCGQRTTVLSTTLSPLIDVANHNSRTQRLGADGSTEVICGDLSRGYPVVRAGQTPDAP